jgi:hypothetical protein
LLEFKTFIDGQENFETALLRQGEEFPIFLASESSLWNGQAVMNRDASLELAGHALIDEDFHPS